MATNLSNSLQSTHHVVDREQKSDEKNRNLHPISTAEKISRYSPMYENSWAVVIGINRYDNSNHLEYAVNDAVGIAKILVSKFGFRKEQIFALLDTARLWEWRSRSEIFRATSSDNADPITAAGVNAAGTWLFTATHQGLLRVWPLWLQTPEQVIDTVDGSTGSQGVDIVGHT